jgi:Skp family chaperone for outer membrane proteins
MTTPLPPADGGQQVTPVPPTQQVPAPQTITVTQPTQQFFTADQLEAARKQEKDKLYSELEGYKTQVNSFQEQMTQWTQERDAAQAKLKADQDAADALARKAEEDKLSVKELMDKREAEWNQKQQEMQQQWDKERAISQKERELFQLQSFIQRRIAEEVAQDNIAPEFLDYIDGSSEAEVEASITKAKEKTASIVAGIGGQTPPATPGVSPAGYAPSGPMDNLVGTKQYSAQDINSMSMQEYAKFRAQAGVDKAGNDHGMFN